MCGITGHWAYAAEDLDRATFEVFTDSLAHRGPDGSGIEHDPDARLWLGHRRLAIVDLSERGRQPLSYADGRFSIVHNGEVYNYIELREELRALGHRFVSDTDTEVILAAYAQWGPDCQLRFNGMWAFAIWDARDRRMFLSRDRFGVKPLHYTLRNGAITFASELKAFLALPWIDGAFDGDILSETLATVVGHEATAHTLLPGVQRLPAGHAMLVEADGRIRVTEWWRTLDHLPDVSADFRRQADEFRHFFFDSCRLRLRSDVPLATALSGGLDSSAVACTIAELGRRGEVRDAPSDWQRAFVACFTNTPYDEERYARAVVSHAGMTAHYETIDDSGVVKDIEKMIFDREGIFWGPSAGPWRIYRAMRANGIRVSLDGQGSDELLGGYPQFTEAALDGALMKRFDVVRYFDLRRVLRGLAGGSQKIPRATALGEMKWLLGQELTRLRLLEPLRAVRSRIRSLHARLAGGPPVPEPSEPALRPFVGTPSLYAERADSRTSAMPPLQAMLFSWFHDGLLPTILCNFDRTSMAHGIETRMPFMDWRVVTYCFALPETSKIGGGFTKRVLRAAMDGLIPDPIRLRTNKIPFLSPVDVWARGALAPWLKDLCASRSFRDSVVWNGSAVAAIAGRAVAGQGGLTQIWPIIQAHVLQEAFKARATQHARVRSARTVAQNDSRNS